MKFAYTILYVDDVPSSLAFYEAAFGLQQKMLHESGDYGELETGNTTIAMASKELMPGQSEAGAGVAAAGASSRFFEIAFTTDAVEVAGASSRGKTLGSDCCLCARYKRRAS